jgi:glutamine synthetase
MIPVIATEIEFYLFGSAEKELASFWEEVRAACVSSGIEIFKIEKERGGEQHEVALCATRDPGKIIRDTEQLKAVIREGAHMHGMRADFSAKPLENDQGSGLHVHVHLEDGLAKNLFWKKDEAMSAPLAHSIGGLLALMLEQMAIFAPDAKSRKRFVAGGNAPTTVSWGANNRTCALRLPDKAWDNKHIEHRVAGADAEIAAVVEAILTAMAYGMEKELLPPPQIYGDASLPMYGLQRLLRE